MTIKRPKKTREEEAFGRLLDEKVQLLSTAANTVLGEAHTLAYKDCIVPSYGLQLEEIWEHEEKIRLATADLTDRDRELLAEIAHAAKAAADSIDPNDMTHLGYGRYRRDHYWFYATEAEMIEIALRRFKARNEDTQGVQYVRRDA
jgi:hypothetical protein